MKNSPALDPWLIGYSPVFDQRRAFCALRLSIFPAASSAVAQDGEALWALLVEACEQAPKRPDGLPTLWVHVANEELLDGVLRAAQRTPQRLLIETPAFFAGPRLTGLHALHEQGQPLALSGKPLAPPAPEQWACFDWLCQAADAAQALGPPVPVLAPGSAARQLLRVGARCSADFDKGFEQGAHAVAGWPVDDELQVATPARVPPELRGVLDLMNRVEREEPVARLEAVLTADPSLAYRLLRYLNTSAFGLRSEVTSFRHGLMMLGHQRLKRWLALLLVSGTQDPRSRMLMAVAARRGLILDQLAAGLTDEAMRSEMFICGIFSLLDHMLHVPMEELIRQVPMHERVQMSLLEKGPYSAHLNLLRALEGGAGADIRESAEAALVGRAELNHAVLKGLALSWDLQ